MSIQKDIRDKIADKIHLHASYVRTFETPDGQRVLRHLMRRGFILESTFVAGDPHQTSLNEGARRIVLSIITFLGRDHSELVKQLEQGKIDDTITD